MKSSSQQNFLQKHAAERPDGAITQAASTPYRQRLRGGGKGGRSRRPRRGGRGGARSVLSVCSSASAAGDTQATTSVSLLPPSESCAQRPVSACAAAGRTAVCGKICSHKAAAVVFASGAGCACDE